MNRAIVPRIGYPDEMQAREIILDECRRLGSKNKFCAAVGISRRYLNLIMEWLRPPTHWKIMSYFEWTAVYATLEDLTEGRFDPKPPKPRKPWTRRTTTSERPATQPKSQEEQREYWRRKQRESRNRRHAQLPLH